jgi:hypothetical protein
MESKYRPGDKVLILQRNQPGHVRTPIYIRGKTGVIERVVGSYPNPERLAYGHSGLPYKMLYRVNFKQSDIWDDYDGPADDTLEIEIYEHWLAPA